MPSLTETMRTFSTRKGLSSSLIALTIALSGGSLLIGDTSAQEEEEVQAKPVELITIQAAVSGNRVAIGGTVVPSQQVSLAAQMPGRIMTLAGKEGDSFSEGDLLIALDDQELLAKKAAAEAALTGAQAATRNAAIQYRRELISPQSERPTSMPGMGMPGMMDQIFARPMAGVMGMENPGLQRNADLHQSGTQLTQSRVSAAQAQAQINQIESKLRDTQTLAPFDGVITSKQVEAGDTVQPGQPLMTFADLSSLQVKSDVPARISRKLQAGQSVGVRLDTGAPAIEATIAQVFPVADPQRHTVTIKVDLPEGVDAAPGMYADLLIPDPDAKGPAKPMVPRSALIWRGSLPGVMLASDDGSTKLKLIRISDTGDGDQVRVTAGLVAGDRIVANPN